MPDRQSERKRSQPAGTVNIRAENSFHMEENMNNMKKIILAVSAVLTVAAAAAALYLIIRRCKTKAIISS